MITIKYQSVKKNCSEAAQKIVREKVVSAEAQTRTNQTKITVSTK